MAKVKKPKKVQETKTNPQQAHDIREREPLINGLQKSVSAQPLPPQTGQQPVNHSIEANLVSLSIHV